MIYKSERERNAGPAEVHRKTGCGNVRVWCVCV